VNPVADPQARPDDPAEAALAEMLPAGPTPGLWRPVLLIACVLLLAVAALASGLGGRLAELQVWIGSLGPSAPLAFILVRAGAAVCLVPGSAFSMAAGLFLTPLIAVICVSIGKTLGACIAFLIARYFARDAVARWLSRREKYRHLDDLVALHGAYVVALSRLFPVSFNVANYAFGLTRIRFATYAFWSWLCMLPGAVLVVMGAVVLTTVLETRKVPWLAVGIVFASAGLMLGLAGCVFVRLLILIRRRRAAEPIGSDPDCPARSASASPGDRNATDS
jgi:uncharacterized membrane protein YdjX (TVP38/TMEM64 family)